MKDDAIERIIKHIGEFSDKQFGIRSNPAGPLNHLKEEVQELIDAVGKENEEEEWADCILLLLDAYRIRYGEKATSEKLEKMAYNKLYILHTRKWEEDPDQDGVFRHIKQ